MNVVVDIGNSRLKWAILEGDTLQQQGVATLVGQSLSACLNAQWGELTPPEHVLISSVSVGETAKILQDWCRQHWQVMAQMLVSPAHGNGVRNAYQQSSQLGSDRWAALVAAHHLCHANTCVIDCGTAVTMDVLRNDGQHLGGYIIPGLTMMRGSLAQETAGVGATPNEALKNEITAGTSTRECVNRGTVAAVVGFIEYIRQQLERQDGPYQCLLTGGDAGVIFPYLSGAVHHEPALVLQGLALILASSPEPTRDI